MILSVVYISNRQLMEISSVDLLPLVPKVHEYDGTR
jgi:hypothetical protein